MSFRIGNETNVGYVRLNETAPLDQNRFESFSHHFTNALLQSDKVEDYRPFFKEGVSSQQLNWHLNYLMTHIKFKECQQLIVDPKLKRQILDTHKIMRTQMSLLTPTAMIEAAKWSEGEFDPRFDEHFWGSLEAANELVGLEGRPIITKNKWKELCEMVANGPTNWMLSDAIITDRPPTALFEAQINFTSQLLKFQIAMAMAQATAQFSTAAHQTASFPLALVFFALPPVLSLIRRIYMSWGCNAPVHLYPLSDSRKLDVSVSRNNCIGREEVINAIIKAWENRMHPLLVGPPGVGKTVIMEALMRLTALGKIPGFKDKVVFYGTAAKLAGSSAQSSNTKLENIVDDILPFKKDVVLMLDEIHALFKNVKQKSDVIYLRNVLDDKEKSLTYCLLATTQEEYDTYIKNDQSLGRRIQVINVEPLNKEDMLTLLHREARELSPYIGIHPEAVKTIYEKSEGDQTKARLLLKEVLTAAKYFNDSYAVDQQRKTKKSEINYHYSIYAGSKLSITEKNHLQERILLLKKELEPFEAEYQNKKMIGKMFVHLLEQYDSISKGQVVAASLLYQHIHEFVGTNPSKQARLGAIAKPEFIDRHRDLLKSLLLYQYFDQPTLTRFINDFAKQYHLMTEIDQDFVLQYTKDPRDSNPIRRNSSPRLLMDPLENWDVVPFEFKRDQELPPVPVDGIKTGLPNCGNTCWINAALKFISATNYYDQMLLKEPPKGMERLQGLLGDLISWIRQGKPVSEMSYRAFMYEIAKAFPKFKMGDQHDAPEFLMTLLQGLAWGPLQTVDQNTLDIIHQVLTFPRIAKEYEHAPRQGFEKEDQLPQGWGKPVSHRNFHTMMEVHIPEGSESIDIPQLLAKPSSVLAKPERLDENCAENIGNKPFLEKSYFTCLPKVMMIFLKRFDHNRRKIDSPVQVNGNLIAFDQYGVENQTVNGIAQSKLKYLTTAHYRIGGAITHISDNLDQGHYVFDERISLSNRYVQHDNTLLKNLKEEDFGKSGYLLRLDRVDQLRNNRNKI